MSQVTITRVRFNLAEATAEFYQKLDSICHRVGLTRHVAARTWNAGPETREEWVSIGWHDRVDSVKQKEGAVQLQYAMIDNSFSLYVDIEYVEVGRVGGITIESSDIKGYRKWYDACEMTRAEMVQQIAKGMCDELQAESAIAEVDYFEEPWFRFGHDIRQPIERLHLEEDFHQFKLQQYSAKTDDRFYVDVDSSLIECGFLPHKAVSTRPGYNWKRMKWEERIAAKQACRALKLTYKHQTIDGGFVDVYLDFNEPAADITSLDIEVYLPLGDLGQSNVEQILTSISEQFRKHFDGKLWSSDESKYLWENC